MARSTPAPPFRPRGLAARALFVALLMLTATIGADVHAHAPHGAPAHGTAIRAADEDVTSSCPICRLAHQVSSMAIAPPIVGRPAAPAISTAKSRPAPTATGIEPSCSPRAPPRATACS